MNIEIYGPLTGQGAVCAVILRALPDWFGREDANLHYIASADTMPTFVAYVDQRPAGFLTVKQHYPHAAEIYVMGVLPDHHRQGIGRGLVTAAEDHLRATGTRFLQVKTLGTAHPDPGYGHTRAFYLGIGFLPIEEFEELWGANTPALLLLKTLA